MDQTQKALKLILELQLQMGALIGLVIQKKREGSEIETNRSIGIALENLTQVLKSGESMLKELNTPPPTGRVPRELCQM